MLMAAENPKETLKQYFHCPRVCLSVLTMGVTSAGNYTGASNYNERKEGRNY